MQVRVNAHALGKQRGLQTCIDPEFNYAKTFVCMRVCAYGRNGAIFVQDEAARSAGQCMTSISISRFRITSWKFKCQQQQIFHSVFQ